MKAHLIGLALALAAPLAMADTYVRPYVKKDGTFVQGHYRSSPNSTTLDNYSTQGNINPYTGKRGNVNPYATPKRLEPFEVKPIQPYTYQAPPSYYTPYQPYVAPSRGSGYR